PEDEIGSAAALNIALNVALIPRWGIDAAAWSKVAAYALLAVITFVAGQRVYPIPWEGRRVALMVAMGAATWAASAVVLGPAPLGLRAAARLALLAAFPALLWLARFPTADERGYVMRFLANRRDALRTQGHKDTKG
ncbi:MAG: polysaccharide biosynthesis C-terminal domain-containing protein, partial [Chloroflexi bacterium]|nr:polysaccharide biosynthesis C-terminal domain-containing protein [Chloroflexota bacterium]